MPRTIEIDFESVREAWRESGRYQFWLELRTDDDRMREFIFALEAVHEIFEPVDGPSYQFAARSLDGLVTRAEGVADDEQLDQWLELLAQHFEDQHFSGTIRGASYARAPEWYDVAETRSHVTTPYPPESTAFVAWETEVEPGPWRVSRQATVRIGNHIASWVEPGGPEIIVRRGVFQYTTNDPADIAPTIVTETLASADTGVLRYQSDGAVGRAASVSALGETTFQDIDTHQPWQRRISHLRACITSLPELTQQAFIRPSHRCTMGWEYSIADKQSLPYLEGTPFRAPAQLRDRYVPDAHGIQVLCDAHLARAHDLTHWRISDLGHGRKLVEAADLTSWYSAPLPDPAVVEQARRDFGGMILTEAIVQATLAPS